MGGLGYALRGFPRAHFTPARRSTNRAKTYTYPQPTIKRSATSPGSILDRQGGSEFSRRRQPPQLAADIGRALNAAASIAKEESESRLQQVRAELAELAESGESFEIQIDELTQALAVRTSERDTLVGQLKEQVSEVQESKATFEREQATAEALRLDCAKAQIKSERPTLVSLRFYRARASCGRNWPL